MKGRKKLAVIHCVILYINETVYCFIFLTIFTSITVCYRTKIVNSSFHSTRADTRLLYIILTSLYNPPTQKIDIWISFMYAAKCRFLIRIILHIPSLINDTFQLMFK